MRRHQTQRGACVWEIDGLGNKLGGVGCHIWSQRSRGSRGEMTNRARELHSHRCAVSGTTEGGKQPMRMDGNAPCSPHLWTLLRTDGCDIAGHVLVLLLPPPKYQRAGLTSLPLPLLLLSPACPPLRMSAAAGQLSSSVLN